MYNILQVLENLKNIPLHTPPHTKVAPKKTRILKFFVYINYNTYLYTNNYTFLPIRQVPYKFEDQTMRNKNQKLLL